MRELTYFIAATHDGFIAGPSGETDRFEHGPVLIDYLATNWPETLPMPARQHLGIDAPSQHFDAVVMGRNTFQVGLDQGLTNPYGHLDTQVVFSTTLESNIDPAVKVTAESPVAVVEELKAQVGRGIWLCGGGVLASALIDQINHLVIKRQPLTLGAGRPLFSEHDVSTPFELVDRHEVSTVVVERYRRTTSK